MIRVTHIYTICCVLFVLLLIDFIYVGQVDICDTLDRSEADVRGIVKVHDEPAKDEHHNAALKMQQVHRGKQAKKHVAALKEVR
jgi:hypothetical protein